MHRHLLKKKKIWSTKGQDAEHRNKSKDHIITDEGKLDFQKPYIDKLTIRETIKNVIAELRPLASEQVPKSNSNAQEIVGSIFYHCASLFSPNHLLNYSDAERPYHPFSVMIKRSIWIDGGCCMSATVISVCVWTIPGVNGRTWQTGKAAEEECICKLASMNFWGINWWNTQKQLSHFQHTDTGRTVWTERNRGWSDI